LAKPPASWRAQTYLVIETEKNKHKQNIKNANNHDNDTGKCACRNETKANAIIELKRYVFAYSKGRVFMPSRKGVVTSTSAQVYSAYTWFSDSDDPVDDEEEEEDVRTGSM
jgi:hypothetical protein